MLYSQNDNPFHQRNVGPPVFQNYFPKIEEGSVCLPFGRWSGRVGAEKGKGSIQVAISQQSHVKRKGKRAVFNNLLHSFVFTLPTFKLPLCMRCTYRKEKM